QSPRASRYAAHRPLPPSPTRRSSDLSKLSGLASITSTFSPSVCNDQANAAVMDVVPTPPRTPCNPSTAIHDSPTFVAQIQPTKTNALMPPPTVPVGRYRRNQFLAEKKPYLAPENHFERCSLMRNQAEHPVRCYSFGSFSLEYTRHAVDNFIFQQSALFNV